MQLSSESKPRLKNMWSEAFFFTGHGLYTIFCNTCTIFADFRPKKQS